MISRIRFEFTKLSITLFYNDDSHVYKIIKNYHFFFFFGNINLFKNQRNFKKYLLLVWQKNFGYTVNSQKSVTLKSTNT